METESGVMAAGRPAARALWAHPFAALFIVAVLAGGGLRLVPTSSAAMPGSAGGAASTACAAK